MRFQGLITANCSSCITLGDLTDLLGWETKASYSWLNNFFILLIFNSPIPHQHTCWLLHMFLWFVHAISPKCSTFYSPTLNTISYYLWYQTFYCCVTNLQDGIIFCCFIFPCPQVVLLNLIWLNFALFAATPSANTNASMILPTPLHKRYDAHSN